MKNLKIVLFCIAIVIVSCFFLSRCSGTVTPTDASEASIDLITEGVEESGKTYFIYKTASKTKFINFLNGLDKEKYEIFAITRNRYISEVTYRLKNRSLLEKLSETENVTNDIILYYTASSSDYLNFLEILDEERYAVYSVSSGDFGYFITYVEKN